MPIKKYSLSQEEIFFSAPELEAGIEYREEEGVLKINSWITYFRNKWTM